ncbi:LacI family DNA-binding transcriptional regulator [Pelomonas sp. KK5]|uniref:LacI family DNA-binding transcriptional regulator n=1 Tax=Pelomonas sp. KK5 TaxID=1855730 RepID=UPI00097C9CF8|nr:LacI family DNA-binding transcriptional regulator [Pelomonas sp. KK5]
MAPAPTIADIARAAGVGTATVDRVLNRRPGVNAETMNKVMQVVEALGAPQQPGRPRRGENARFAYVLPAEPTPFLESVERQIAQAAGDFRHAHITEVTHRIDASDPQRFAEELAQLGDCDGLALVAPDLPPVKGAINELVRAGVHVVTLFSDVAGSMRETFIGADNRAAGRTAGLLLGRMAAGSGRDTLLLSSQSTRMTAEIERRIGFAQAIEERFPALRVLRTADLPADNEAARAALRQALKDDIDPARVAGLYNVGSASTGAACALADAGLTVGAIAHDFTDENAALLSSDALSYVLHQDIHYCIQTAARVLRALRENVRGALNVVQPRIQILTAENLH